MNHQNSGGELFAAILTGWKEQIVQMSPPRKIWVASSGGLDSSVLLVLLDHLQRSVQSFEFAVLHVNFALRGEESNRDEAMVRQQAENLGRECQVLSVNPKDHPAAGIQQWARDLRYQWFAEKLGPEDWLAVAHHRDDWVETIFARLCRGHSLMALSGMQVMHKKTWRPLLHRQRRELLSFAEDQKLSWCEDSSNDSLDYTRNRLRKQILPELAQLFPGVADNLWTHSQDIQDCLNALRTQFPALPDSDRLGRSQLLGMPPFLARQEISSFLQKHAESFKPRRDMLQEILGALESGVAWERILNPEQRLICHNGVLTVASTAATPNARWLQYRTSLLDVSPEQWPEGAVEPGEKS